MHKLIFLQVFFVISIFIHITSSIQIGRIENGILWTNNTNTSIILSISSSNCLCQALMASPVVAVVAINYFSNNNTCQLISSYEPMYEVRVDSMSTLFIIEALPVRSSPANLTWLLDTSKLKV